MSRVQNRSAAMGVPGGSSPGGHGGRAGTPSSSLPSGSPLEGHLARGSPLAVQSGHSGAGSQGTPRAGLGTSPAVHGVGSPFGSSGHEPGSDRWQGGAGPLHPEAGSSRHGSWAGSGSLRHYYVAVDRQQFKMGTLVDLLEVLGRNAALPLAIACSSRDVLDSLVAATSALPLFTVNFLSDQGEAERASLLEAFRRTVAEWATAGDGSHQTETEGGGGEGQRARRAHLLVATDACLPSQAMGEQSLGARLLINYDIPAKKEAYLRRISSCLSQAAGAAMAKLASGHGGSTAGSNSSGAGGASAAAGGLVINFVVAGEVSVLRHMEEGCHVIMDEMPIHISEML